MYINRVDITPELVNELEELLKKHESEVSEVSLEFDPNQLLYYKAQASQSYAGYVARDDSGNAIGYIGYWVGYHPHYSEMMAHQDLFFVVPKNRNNQMVGIKLLKYSEEDLKNNFEVKLIIHGFTSKIDLTPLFIRSGYKEGGKIFKKEI